MAHAAGQPASPQEVTLTLPLRTSAVPPPPGAGPAVICLRFAVVLLLFLGGLVAADRGFVDKGPEDGIARSVTISPGS